MTRHDTTVSPPSRRPSQPITTALKAPSPASQRPPLAAPVEIKMTHGRAALLAVLRRYMDPGTANRVFGTRGFERYATCWHDSHVLAAILVSSLSFEVTEQ